MNVEKSISILSQRIWIEEKKKEWGAINCQGDNTKIHNFFCSVIEYSSLLDDPIKTKECLLLLEKCYNQLDSKEFYSEYLPGLASLGYKAYADNQLSVAEIAFRVLSNGNNTSARNNYAYMIRRGEVTDPSTVSPLKALRLLNYGVKKMIHFHLLILL